MSGRQSLRDGADLQKNNNSLPAATRYQPWPEMPEEIKKGSSKEIAKWSENVRTMPKHLLPPLIIIPFPFDKFSKYLEDIGVSSFMDLNNSQIEAIFVAVINDYKKGRLSIDDLACIGSNFLSLGLKKSRSFFDSRLGEALHAAEETGFYVRQISANGSNEETSQFIHFLRKVLSFAKDSQTKGGD